MVTFRPRPYLRRPQLHGCTVPLRQCALRVGRLFFHGCTMISGLSYAHLRWFSSLAVSLERGICSRPVVFGFITSTPESEEVVGCRTWTARRTRGEART